MNYWQDKARLPASSSHVINWLGFVSVNRHEFADNLRAVGKADFGKLRCQPLVKHAQLTHDDQEQMTAQAGAAIVARGEDAWREGDKALQGVQNLFQQPKADKASALNFKLTQQSGSVTRCHLALQQVQTYDRNKPYDLPDVIKLAA